MIPVHELLARIRWDPQFGRGRFVIGYLDKVAGEVRYIALQNARPDPDNPSLFDVTDEEGVEHSIPLHRIREVLRDGETIWRRAPLAP
ncbi:MAG: DUF504 domain-containing protein [Pseudomonadota bacterium]